MAQKRQQAQGPHRARACATSSSLPTSVHQRLHLNVCISTSASQRLHLNVRISTSASQRPHLNVRISTSASQRPHLNVRISTSNSDSYLPTLYIVPANFSRAREVMPVAAGVRSSSRPVVMPSFFFFGALVGCARSTTTAPSDSLSLLCAL